MSGARAGGAETGRTTVRGTPQFQQTERNVAVARGTGAAEGRVEVEGRPGTQAVKRKTAESTKLGAEAGEARTNLANLTQASAILDEMDTMSDKMITATTGMEANTQALKLFGERTVSGGSLPAVYEARKKNLAEALARNIGGVKGTATEGDIKRMVDGAPGVRDTKQSRAYKIGAMRTIIGSAIENQKRLIAGEPIDLNQARAQFSKLVDDFVGGKVPTPGQTPATRGAPKILSITPVGP
jgi:hypothetical protein